MTAEGFAEGVVLHGSPGGSECQMFLSLCKYYRRPHLRLGRIRTRNLPNKKWLKSVTKRVANQANRYRAQLPRCGYRV